MTTTQKETSVKTNPDGTTTITSNTISKNVKNEIKLDSDTKVAVSEVDAEGDDKVYLDIIKTKNQLAILKGTNNFVCMLSLPHLENILKKMGSNLKDEMSLISFGIYSMEEISEIRKSSVFDVPKAVFKNVTKYLDINQNPVKKMNNTGKNLDNTLMSKRIKKENEVIKNTSKIFSHLHKSIHSNYSFGSKNNYNSFNSRKTKKNIKENSKTKTRLEKKINISKEIKKIKNHMIINKVIITMN